VADEEQGAQQAGQEQSTNPGGGADPNPNPDPQPGSGDNWLSALPEDLRGNEALKGFKSPDELAKAHLETLGKIPGPPPEAYELGAAPEGYDKPFPVIEAFAKGPAKELGLSQEQFGKLAGFTNKYLVGLVQEQKAAQEKANQEATDALKTEWGGEYEAKVQAADAFMAKAGLAEAFKELGINEHPTIRKAMAGLSKVIKEDSFEGGGGGGQGDGDQSPAAKIFGNVK